MAQKALRLQYAVLADVRNACFTLEGISAGVQHMEAADLAIHTADVYNEGSCASTL